MINRIPIEIGKHIYEEVDVVSEHQKRTHPKYSEEKQDDQKIYDKDGNVTGIKEGSKKLHDLVKGDKFYSFRFGVGNPMKILVVNRTTKIKLGYAERYLEPIERSKTKGYLQRLENKLLKEICKEYTIKHTGIPRADLIRDMAAHLSGVDLFYIETDPIDIKYIKNKDNFELKELVEEYIKDGAEYDKKIFYLFKTGILEVSPEIINPKDIMPYNEHMLMFTAPKVGKTSMADRVGVRYENASISNLLGFSTADESFEGSLNNETQTVHIDEVQDEKGKELWGKTLSLLEVGTTTVAKGGRTIPCKSYCPMKFMGNPRVDEFDIHTEKERLLAEMMSEMLQKVTTNYKAFGSRMSVFIFGLNQTEVKTKLRHTREKRAEMDALIYTLKKKMIIPYSKLWINESIIKWLNKEYSEEYKALVTNLISGVGVHSIKEFLDGLKYNYRHIRGLALKLTVMDNLKMLVEDELDLEKIINQAEGHLLKLQKLNIDSIKEFIIATDHKFVENYYHACFASESEHIKALLDGIHRFSEEHPEFNFPGSLDIVLLEPSIRSSSHIDEQKLSFSKCMRRIKYNKGKTNQDLGKYGIYMIALDDQITFSVKDIGIIEKIKFTETQEDISEGKEYHV